MEYSLHATMTYRVGTNDTPFLFNGRYGVMSDPNGLLYMRARYYSPYLCRFINPDPSGFKGGLNFYAAFGGNPVSYIDPFGLNKQATGDSDFYWNNSIYNTSSPEFSSATKYQESALEDAAEFAQDVLDDINTAIQWAAKGGGGGNETQPLAVFGLLSLVFPESDAALLEAGTTTEGTTASITTSYAVEVQSSSAEAQAALVQAQNGAMLYRTGQLGESMAGESQYWSLENPLLKPNYANVVGLPDVTPDFVMTGTLNSDATAIVNEAPGLGANAGGGLQVVTTPDGVGNLNFLMP
jgi:RHS repeat-associated protein